MKPSEELREYVKRLHTRLRLGAIARGAAIVCGIALGLTPLLVMFANQFAFSAASNSPNASRPVPPPVAVSLSSRCTNVRSRS